MPIQKLRPTYTFDEERLAALKAVVPEAFADGLINWDTLRDLLGDYLEDEGGDAEHFGLTWPGKRQARRLAGQPSKGTLAPAPGEGVDEANTRNLFIEGDNLEVLKLLQKSYAGRIKLIYIDPPYNTGNDFIYPDDYSEPLESYLKRTGQMGESGELLTSNPKSSGRFHSTWLSFLYPRLRLAKSLLSEDGVVFVSIDDNEVHNFRLLLNEIFGENNFFAQVIVQSNKRGQTYKQISKTHEYLLIYTNTDDTEVNELEKSGEKDDLNLEDNLGNFNVRELRNRNPKFGRFNRPNLFYPIYVNPKITDNDGFSPIALTRDGDYKIEIFPLNSSGGESCWRWGKEKTLNNIGDRTLTSNAVARKKSSGGYNVYEKYRKSTYKAKSIWFENEVITEKGTIELRQLELGEFFDFPKPVFLIKKILMIGTNAGEQDIILDFFSGSCTTAQAVLEQNREDNGNRRFIMVQLPEPTNNPDFPTIADIGKERIRRVISKLKEENKGKLDFSTRETSEDLGFKVFKLTRSNFKRWDAYEGDDTQQLELRFDEAETPLVPDWQVPDLLTEVILQQGFPLDSTVTPLAQFKANHIVAVESDFHDYRLVVCLDRAISDATIESLALAPEDIFVCLDSALSDQAKARLTDTCNLNVI